MTAERDRFIAQFCRQLPEGVRLKNGVYFSAVDAARLILRHAKTHGRMAEAECNGHPLQSMAPPQGCDLKAWNARVNKAQAEFEAWTEKRTAQVEKRLAAICEPFGVTVDCGGDPRGYTVKLRLPEGTSNTWGQDGYGVPQ
jgi:hypothetical protein